MLNVIMLNVENNPFMLRVVMLSVIMLIVVAPKDLSMYAGKVLSISGAVLTTLYILQNVHSYNKAPTTLK
jgi:hypothetical protein